MNSMDLIEILKKYKEGTASEAEVEFLYAYYDLFDADEDVLKTMQPEELELLKAQMFSAIKEKMQEEEVVPNRNKIKTFRWLAAASVLILVVAGAIIFSNKKPAENTVYSDKNTKKDTASQLITPGGNYARLVLADGSIILLDENAKGEISVDAGNSAKIESDGHIVYGAGNKAAGYVINKIETPKGGQYQLTLSDGTQVWLNAESSISFPTLFTGTSRDVKITGEVYFEVAKNKNLPFKVQTTNQEIEVLGTQFNINTYNDEPIERTTLVEGSVKVTRVENSGSEKNRSVILIPGQQSIVDSANNNIRVQKTDVEAAIAWKNGYFKFDQVDIQHIMRQVSRWYNVEVEYRGGISKDLFVGKISRNENLESVLKVLSLSKIKTTIEGRKIIIWN